MKSLMTLTGILAFSFSSFSYGKETTCLPSAEKLALECAGTATITSIAELNSYANDLGLKKGKAKNLSIVASLSLSSDLVISSPCSIKIADDVTISSTGNICLHGQNGVNVGERFKFNGKNLFLESRDEVIVKNNSEITADDVTLLSIGSGDTSKAHIRDAAVINAKNLFIESRDKGSLGKNSNITLSGSLGIYTIGDDEASIRAGSHVIANKIEISSMEETRVAKDVSLNANEVILNGISCNIHKTALITSDNKMGNCFLESIGKAGFSIDKNQGSIPLTVNFNASSLAAEAKGFVWSFGDGETLNTISPTVSHVYTRSGSFTATLKYATKENFKGLKNAGFIQIDAKVAPVVVPTTPPRGNFSYAQDGTFVYLKAFIRKTQFDIASAYYVIDDNQNNKIYMTNFYQNSISSVEMNTFGTHKVTMYVEDVQGQKYNTTMMIDLKQNEDDIAPIVRFYGEQSAPRTAFINMASSFIPYPDEFLKDFKVEFGDGQVVEVHDAVSVVHTYAAPGTYNVKVTAEFNGNERFAIIPVTVTNDNKAALSPVAAFDYHLFDFAGNVTFNDDRSATPNGEIISYVWNFGDGTQAYGKLVSHFFGPGDHVVSLTVTDTMGLTSTQRQMISIAEPGDDIVSNLSCWKDGDMKIACDVFALDKFDEITRVRVQWGDGTSVNLTNQAEIEEWGLYFAEHVYQNYGTYNLRLTVDTARGQTKYAYASEVFIPYEQPSLVYAKIFCSTSYMTVNCVADGTTTTKGYITDYIFDFDNGERESNANGVVTYRYSEPGNYTVKLKAINSFGMYQEVSAQVNMIASIPVANLSCFSRFLRIECNSISSYDFSQSPLKFEFDMGDGTVLLSSTGLISHIYSGPGVYQVKLKAINFEGMTGETQNNFQILDAPANQPPVIVTSCFSLAPFSLRCDLHSSYDSDGTIVKYSINFEGVWVEQASASFTYQYQNGGNKSVLIKVEDDSGNISEIAHFVTVKENTLPIANFECTSSPLRLNCFSLSEEKDDWDTIVSYEWDMGDEYKIAGLLNTSISHQYIQHGNYTISLKVKDQYGGESYLEKIISVSDNMAPTASITCSKSGPVDDLGQYLCFGEASDVDGYIVDRGFRINGMVFNETSYLTYDFLNGGETVVEYYVKDNLGKETTVYTTVVRDDIPKVSFNCLETQPYHINCSAVDVSNALNYMYVIDGEIFQGKNIQFDVDLSGSRNIKLRVLTPFAEIVHEVGFDVLYKYVVPKADFVSYVETSKRVRFNALKSYLQDRKIKKFIWDFGDGDQVISTSESVEHTYSQNQEYSVRLVVEDFNGATSSISQNVYVYDPEVEDPGEMNDELATGVDSDGDYVRDDIQRWIAFEAKNNSLLKLNLKKLARATQEQFLNPENRSLLLLKEERKQKVKACLLGNVQDDNLGYYYIDMIDYFYSSTESGLRLKAKVEGNLWGIVPEIPETILERLEKCAEI